MAFHRWLGEAGNFVGGNFRYGFANEFGGAAPPGAEHERDVVLLNAGAIRDVFRCFFSAFKRVINV